MSLAACLWLTLAVAAWAHGAGHTAGSPHVKLDPGEVASLGEEHAREHAVLRVLQRRARERARRMTPAQRQERQRAVRRSEQRLDRALDGQPRDDLGFWGGERIALPDYAIHASMMPTGKLLIFGRQPGTDGNRSNVGSAAVFDPKTGTSHAVPPPAIAENDGDPAAIFCAGQALLSDGRVLLVGGNLSDPAPGKPGFSGLNYTFLFDPWTETWEVGPKMSHGRWYPTVVKLSSGDFLIYSGLDESGLPNGTNPEMDLFRPGIDDVNPATPLVPFPAGFRGPNAGDYPDSKHGQSLYPRMFTLPDGNVVLASPGTEDSAILNTQTAIDRDAPLGSAWTQLSTNPSNHYGGTAVLEPQMGVVSGSWKVLVAGGTADVPPGTVLEATNVVERLDASPSGPPGWQPIDPQEQLNTSRYYLNNVLLPDGGMVVVGGGSGNNPFKDNNYYIADPAPPELRQVELRRPGEKSWRLGAAQQEWRTYHSTASLLPDGRIFSGGDDYHEGDDPFNPLPDTERRDSAEIYWPPYLFNGDTCAPRPVIRGVGATTLPTVARTPAATLAYGEAFGIFSEHARAGMQAVLVAPSAVTHSVDMNQRVVPLRVTSRVAGGGLNVRAPAGAGIAQPGWYMVFVIDADGTPSIARWVRLLPSAEAIAARGGRVPATVTKSWPNAKGRSCVNPDGTTISEPDPPPPPPLPPPPVVPVKATAKLGVSQATIKRDARRLDVRASITTQASGTVKIELLAGKRRTSFKAKIDSAKGRIALLRRIPRSQAKVGTGIITITYDGDGDTRPQSVRLRAAPRAAHLSVKRPVLTASGRLKADGTISKRARGVVHLQLQYVFAGTTRTVVLRARISKGKWKLDAPLSAAVRAQIAQRSGTLHSYTLFTGYEPAGLRGEVRSYQVLPAP